MAESHSAHRKNRNFLNAKSAPTSAPEGDNVETLSPLSFQLEDSDGWTTLDEPLLYVYAGKGPFVGR